jgi:hypothetical protein
VIQRAINMATNAGLSSRLQLFDKRTFINLLIKHILNLSPMSFYYRLLLQASITLILAILILSSSYNFLQVVNALLSLHNSNKHFHVIQVCCAWNDKLADGHAISARKNIKLVQPGEAVISFDASGLITHVDIDRIYKSSWKFI